MSSTLHDQLSRLAEEAIPPEDATPGTELWTRGTRYRRRMRNGSLLIMAAAVAALALLTGATVRSAGPAPEPAPANAPAGLPSRIHVPSPWLPGTDDVGPPGETIALFPADRGGWTGTTRSLVAVSAATGDYRFLDLPDAVTSESVVLSPDGRRIAYWTTGPTSGTPNTGEITQETVAGVAVYDTRTGDVVRHVFATEHGLWPTSLAWIDASSLVIRHLQFLAGDDGPDMEQGSGNDESSWKWDLSRPEPEPWQIAQKIHGDDWGAPANGRVAVGNVEDVFVVDGSSSRAVQGGSRLNSSVGRYAISPDGTRIAGIWGNDRTPNDVAILTVVPAGEGDLARLDEADLAFEVEGWRDDHHVVVTRDYERTGRREPGMGVFSVDARSGSVEQLVTLPSRSLPGPQWATDLLSAPVVDRPAPPTPLDPRLVRGLAALTLLAAGFALWRWRRRVTP